MHIMDRYLLSRYVHSFLVMFITLCGLYLVIDAFTRFDEFSENSGGTTAIIKHMSGYYAFRALLFFDRIAGVVGMMAAIFTLTWLQRQGELTALFAAGVPLYRLAVPVLCASLCVSGLQVVNQEFVIPEIRDQLLRDADDFTGNKAKKVEGAHDHRTNVFIGGEYGYPQERRISGPQIILPETIAETLTFVRAENAFFVPQESGRVSGWELIGVDSTIAIRPEGKKIIWPLKDSKVRRYFLASDVTYDQVARRQEWYQFASTPELIRLLANQSMGLKPDRAVEVHARFLQPLLNLLLVMVTLPTAMARGDRNLFLNMGSALVVTALFSGTVYASHYLGNAGWFTPALAAWIPLILFSAVAASLTESVAT